MKKIALTLLFAAIVMLGSGVDGPALYASSFNIKIGLFHPLLQSDLWETNMENLAFDKKDMQNAYYGVEYEYFLNRFISFAFEGGYYIILFTGIMSMRTALPYIKTCHYES